MVPGRTEREENVRWTFLARAQPVGRHDRHENEEGFSKWESLLSGTGGSRTLVQLRKPNDFYMLSLPYIFEPGQVADIPTFGLIRNHFRSNVTIPVPASSAF